MLARRAAVLISADELRARVSASLSAQGYRLMQPAGAFPQVSPELLDNDLVVIECTSNPKDPGIEIAERLRAEGGTMRVVVLATQSSEELAIAAIRIGASDYLKYPFDLSRLAPARRTALAQAAVPSPGFSIIGESAAAQSIRAFIARVAPLPSNVLVVGETGTGKEMVARQLHLQSLRSNRPFVCVNSAAIPDSLLESELFGYEKGAFTGAVARRDGKLAQAQGGTVFFDEIGDMSLSGQAKILRAIESREIYRLGGHHTTSLDVRIIAATNRDLEAMVAQDRFRADLYFRLNVARIDLPPLRERTSDIPLLIEYLLPFYNRAFGASVQRFDPPALEKMAGYSWPGNIRELKNVLEVIFLNLPANAVTVKDLPLQVRRMWEKLNGLPPDERESLLSLLLSTRWNVSEAARKMHWSRMTMYRKLAKYKISPERRVTTKPATGTHCDSA